MRKTRSIVLFLTSASPTQLWEGSVFLNADKLPGCSITGCGSRNLFVGVSLLRVALFADGREQRLHRLDAIGLFHGEIVLLLEVF